MSTVALPKPSVASWRFWALWAAAFLGFPIGGGLAYLLVGQITTPVQATVAGAVTGAILGAVQWAVLRLRLPMPIWWVVATSAGLAVGLAISTALLGTESTGAELLGRAAITGLGVGVAQWLVLRRLVPWAAVWIAVIGLGWVLGWFVSGSIGIGPSWSVFGASGALAFQLLTGLALYVLLRPSRAAA
jgi:hypothetical protein